MTYGSTYGTLPTPTRTGYSFTGWFTDKSGGTQIKADTKVAITTNQTLYAQWQINKVTVHFNANDGTITSGGDYYIGTDSYVYTSKDKKILDSIWSYNQKYKDGLYNPETFRLSRTGYTFVGWIDGERIFDPKDANVSANDLYPDITTKSGTITLYAKWDINKVNVHYNANGGTIASGGDYYVGTDSNVYTSKDKKILDNFWQYNEKKENGLYNATTFKLVKDGYKFVGWSNGSTVFDQDDSSVSANALYPDITTKSGTIFLYAKWEKMEVTGDCDNDGKLGVTDVIMLQKWILSTKNAKLANAKAADLNGDGVIDVFDLALMKRKLISKK